jgi:8-oxo-dGTP pyrophosphatase MutT (NUDIX family)
MRERPSSRLLTTTPNGRVLLFRFVHKTGALAGKVYWATPGGGLEKNETFVDAAIRELNEETGIRGAQVVELPIRREFPLRLPSGEYVLAIEQYFLVKTNTESMSSANWTAEEIEVMSAHRWWHREELVATTEIIYPEELIEILDEAGVFAMRDADKRIE